MWMNENDSIHVWWLNNMWIKHFLSFLFFFWLMPAPNNISTTRDKEYRIYIHIEREREREREREYRVFFLLFFYYQRWHNDDNDSTIIIVLVFEERINAQYKCHTYLKIMEKHTYIQKNRPVYPRHLDDQEICMYVYVFNYSRIDHIYETYTQTHV